MLNYPYGSTKTRAPHCRHHIHGARRISNSLPCDKALLGCAHQNLQHPPGGGDATERIGADPNNRLYFSGTLDDVRLYNRALSATKIKQLYNAGR